MSDLSLDDELLMLAGSGDESGEEGEVQVKERASPRLSRSASRSISRSPSRSRSRSPPPRHSRSPSPTSASRSPLPPSASKMSRSRTERRKKDDSEEEGEASDAPGSPGSLGSGAMEESDSEASDAESSSGRRGVIGETAFEREKRLAEQAEREEERLKTAKLKALISERTRTDSKSSKRKVDNVDLDEDDYERPSRRAKKETSTSNRRANHRRSDLSDSPQNDGYQDDEVKPKKDDGRQPGTLQEYERVRMGRSRFAQVCFYPGFEGTFVGCYARVCSSVDPMTGQNVYRICQIKSFKSAKPYKLVGNEDRAYMTDQWVVASYGPIEKEYPFAACSDSKFTEDEFLRRNQMLESQSIKQSTSAFLSSKCADVNDFLNTPWTSAQISEKVANQYRLAHLMIAPTNKSVGPETLQRDEALYRRNIENRKLNAEQVRTALLADRKKRRMAAEDTARKQREEIERKKKAEVDQLFGDGADSELPTAQEENKPKAVSKYVHRDYKNGLNDFTRVKTDDEIIASLDIDIEIDI